jgi:hypothetical protein
MHASVTVRKVNAKLAGQVRRRGWATEMAKVRERGVSLERLAYGEASFRGLPELVALQSLGDSGRSSLLDWLLCEAAHGASTTRINGYNGSHQSPDRFGLGPLPTDGASCARPADDARVEKRGLKEQGYYFWTMAAVECASTNRGLAPHRDQPERASVRSVVREGWPRL